jgi:hypothetical protein
MTNASWKSENVIAYAPQEMLCDADGQEGADAVNGFVTGLATGDSHINPFRDIPWRAWVRPMKFWLPLSISFLVAVMGLAAVLNRQWSDHEQLPYPIVQFISSMFPDEEGGLSAIFKNKLFIAGFTLSFLILLDNYLCRWFPDSFIPIRLRYDFTPAMKILPIMVKGKGAMLFSPIQAVFWKPCPEMRKRVSLFLITEKSSLTQTIRQKRSTPRSDTSQSESWWTRVPGSSTTRWLQRSEQ